LQYHGALGNSHQPTNNPANTNGDELRPALDDVLSGKPSEVTETKAFGCSIKRVKVS
jgi:hypothetical protein